MKVLAKIFIILLIAGIFISCGEPVGSIYAGDGEKNFLLIHPHRWFYVTGNWFIPETDFQIIMVSNGFLNEIPVSTPGVEISLYINAHDAGLPHPIYDVPYDEGVELLIPGRHEVRVTYMGRTGRYTLEVRDSFSGSFTEDDPFKIIWL